MLKAIGLMQKAIGFRPATLTTTLLHDLFRNINKVLSQSEISLHYF
jgi:hypothetical protein